jgi:hypothetical protein
MSSPTLTPAFGCLPPRRRYVTLRTGQNVEIAKYAETTDHVEVGQFPKRNDQKRFMRLGERLEGRAPLLLDTPSPAPQHVAGEIPGLHRYYLSHLLCSGTGGSLLLEVVM